MPKTTNSYYQLLHSLEFRLFNKAKLFDDNKEYITKEGKANWRYINQLFKTISEINKELKHQINCKPQIFQCLNIVLNPLSEKDLFDGAIIYLQQYLYTDELKKLLRDLDKSYQKCYDAQKKYYEEHKNDKKQKDDRKGEEDKKEDKKEKDDRKGEEDKKEDKKKDDDKKEDKKKNETEEGKSKLEQLARARRQYKKQNK